jgi:hypothetical protein
MIERTDLKGRVPGSTIPEPPEKEPPEKEPPEKELTEKELAEKRTSAVTGCRFWPGPIPKS